MAEICIQCLASRNEGNLHFEWVDLPASQDDIDRVLKSSPVANAEEYEIADTDGVPFIKYGNIEAYNEFQAVLDNDQYDQDVVVSVMNHFRDITVDHLIECLDNYRMSGKNEHDIAYGYVEECFDIPDNMKHYFDYDALIRDMKIEGYFINAGFEECYYFSGY